jgi:inorganic triphosphatase YgiF
LVVDVYRDTADGTLATSGWALRYRSVAGVDGFLKTQKALTAVAANGIASREELEEHVAAIDENFDKQPLTDLFKVFQDRWVWQVRGSDGLWAEASYDFVQWRKRGDRGVLCAEAHEVEIELKSGNAHAQALANLISQVERATGWPTSAESKYARGLKLVQC